jgi:hypothetical protein
LELLFHVREGFAEALDTQELKGEKKAILLEQSCCRFSAQSPFSPFIVAFDLGLLMDD